MCGVPEPDDALALAGRPRRQVLTMAGTLLGAGMAMTLTGCRLRLEPTPLVTPPPPTADEKARARAASDADRLLSLLEQVRHVVPDEAVLLGRIATDHQAHLAALRVPASTTTPTPKVTGTPSGTATATGPTLTRATALTVLARGEGRAAERVRRDLSDVSSDLARLLAAIGASLDCHADALSRPRRAGS
jgi:hypothetical protein